MDYVEYIHEHDKLQIEISQKIIDDAKREIPKMIDHCYNNKHDHKISEICIGLLSVRFDSIKCHQKIIDEKIHCAKVTMIRDLFN